MITISFRGQVTRLSETGFLRLVMQEGEAAASFVETSCHSYEGGFPDIYGHTRTIAALLEDELGTLLPHVGDKSLSGSLHALLDQLRKSEELGQHLLTLVAAFVQQTPPRTPRDYRRLRRKLEIFDTTGPVWVQRQETQELIEQVRRRATSIKEAKSKFDEHIARLLASAAPEPESSSSTVPRATLPPLLKNDERERGWDLQLEGKHQKKVAGTDRKDHAPPNEQRVKDLIDEAESQLELARAMQLLRNALRLGRKGRQARRAFLGLAMCYEQLNKPGFAIRYYTKAIMSDRAPWGSGHFRRGLLYYRVGRLVEARHDFEQALELRLPESERKDARSLLAQIKNISRTSPSGGEMSKRGRRSIRPRKGRG